MKRRDFVAFGAAAWPFAAFAQQSGKVYRIAFLGQASQNDLFSGSDLATLTRNLEGLGYFAGKNLMVESRYAEGRIERLPRLPASWWTPNRR